MKNCETQKYLLLARHPFLQQDLSVDKPLGCNQALGPSKAGKHLIRNFFFFFVCLYVRETGKCAEIQSSDHVGKWLDLSEPPFLPLQNGCNNSSYFIRSLRGSLPVGHSASNQVPGKLWLSRSNYDPQGHELWSQKDIDLTPRSHVAWPWLSHGNWAPLALKVPRWLWKWQVFT